MTQKDIIAEIKRELAMRRKVWPRIPQQEETFVSSDHQRQYNALKAALSAFEAMTPAEFQTITTRAERQRHEAEKQTSLFK